MIILLVANFFDVQKYEKNVNKSKSGKEKSLLFWIFWVICVYLQTKRIIEMPNKLTRHIPNAVTSCNLLSGCIACVFALQGNYSTAFLFILLGACFDFLDGLTARALRAYSNIGKELDSLADDITFGLAPSAMIFSLLREGFTQQYGCDSFSGWGLLPFVAFIVAVFSALRLAKFNIDERQTSSFIGLPTPANAIFWGSLITGMHEKIIASPSLLWATVALIALMSWLLVAEIPMFSLKFHNLSWKENKVRYIFLAVSLALLIALQLNGFAAVIGWYIILSLLTGQQKTDTKE